MNLLTSLAITSITCSIVGAGNPVYFIPSIIALVVAALVAISEIRGV